MTTSSDKRIIVVACVHAFILDAVDGDLDELALNAIKDELAHNILSSPTDYIVFQASNFDAVSILDSEYVSDKFLKSLHTDNIQVCEKCIEKAIIHAKTDYRAKVKYNELEAKRNGKTKHRS